MNDNSRVEARVAALIAGYADRAPIDVDPMAMTRLVAADRGRRAPAWLGVAPAGRSVGFGLLVLAMLATLVAGALIAGGAALNRTPDEVLTERVLVEPYIGLPPEGAPVSTPETGELVLAFFGRVSALGMKFHRVWVYSDGRLIWIREGSLPFGASTSSTGVLEQRLSPEGVELMRSEAISTGQQGDPRAGNNAGLLWGDITVRQGEQLVDVNWLDSNLPGRLADPAKWLPASAWADQRIGAYVPARHAVCIEPSGVLNFLPDATTELIRSRARDLGRPARESEDLRCPFRVTTEDARAIMASFADAGIPPEPYHRYHIPFAPGQEPGWLEILPVLPHDEVVCDCG